MSNTARPRPSARLYLAATRLASTPISLSGRARRASSARLCQRRAGGSSFRSTCTEESATSAAAPQVLTCRSEPSSGLVADSPTSSSARLSLPRSALSAPAGDHTRSEDRHGLVEVARPQFHGTAAGEHLRLIPGTPGQLLPGNGVDQYLGAVGRGRGGFDVVGAPGEGDVDQRGGEPGRCFRVRG